MPQRRATYSVVFGGVALPHSANRAIEALEANETMHDRKAHYQHPTPKRVKSAARVLEVLEYFDEIRDDACVMDVARALGYPQSSTTELLRSLRDMGYLVYLPEVRRYRPTHRIALLGSWIPSVYMTGGRITAMMEELAERTQETVILAEQSSVFVRYIYVVPSKARRLPVGPGTIRPLARSGIGRLFMSTFVPERAQFLLRCINANLAPGEEVVTYSQLKPELDRIREQGYDVLTRGVSPGNGIVSMLLPHREGEPQLALGVGGVADQISRNASELVHKMRNAIDCSLAPTAQ